MSESEVSQHDLNIVGKFYLGKNPEDGINLVWGTILERVDNTYLVGFFEWKEIVTEVGHTANLSAEQIKDWKFFETADELNSAVLNLFEANTNG
jgi:hypothetical protein